MKNLMQQPIYNFFISTIDEIKNKVEQGDNFPALLALSVLQEKLGVLDYEPFADYQTIIQQLNIRDQLRVLLEHMFWLSDGNNEENVKPFIMQSLDQLKAFAHFLNFLECSYTLPELVKKHIKTILVNTGIQLGVVFQEIRRDSDCSDNTHMNIEEKQKELLANPSEIELENYNKIIAVYTRFIGNEEAQINTKAKEFAVLLFNDLKAINKDAGTMSRLNGDENNLFILGEIEAVVKLSDKYKNDFQQQIIALSEASPPSPIQARLR